MRRFLAVPLVSSVFFCCLAAFGQTVTTVPVTGNLSQILGTPSPYAGVKIDLENCPAPVTIPGQNVVVQTEIQISSDSSGVVTSNVWPTDKIDCNGTTGNAQYGVQYIVNGVPTADAVCYSVLSTSGVWNLNTAQPIACNQTPPNPQDVTYNNVVVNQNLSAATATIPVLNGRSTLNLPLTGGTLTGPVSGTTATFQAQNGIYYAGDYGDCATGTDDETCVNSLISAVTNTNQLTIQLPSGTMTANNPIVIGPSSAVAAGTPTVVNFVCPAKDCNIVKNFSTNPLFEAHGAVTSTTTTLAANAAPGALSLTVTSATGFAAGQWIQIWDSSDSAAQCTNPSPGSNGSCNLELQQIESVVGNTISLKTSLDGSYATASGATVTVVNPVEVKIDGIQINTASHDAGTVEFLYAVDSKVLNTKIQGGAQSFQEQIFVRRSKGIEIAGNTLGNADGLIANGQNVLPLTISEASAYVTVHDNSIRKFVESGATTYSHHIDVHDNLFEGFSDDAFNTHGYNVHDVKIHDNVMSGTPANTSAQTICVVIGNGSSSHYSDHDISVYGNHCSSYILHAYLVDGKSGLQVQNVKISGNYADSPQANPDASQTDGAFQADFGTNITFTDNHVIGVQQNQIGFLLIGVQGFSLVANEVRGSSLGGEMAYYLNAGAGNTVTNGSVIANQYSGCTSAGFYFGSTVAGGIDQVTALGNKGTGATTPFFASGGGDVTNFLHFLNDGDTTDNLTENIATSGTVSAGAGLQVEGGAWMTANHGNGTNVQHSDGSGADGNLAKFASGNAVDSSLPATEVPIFPTSPTTGKAACIKQSSPLQLGYCSTQPDATGACTCN